MAGTRVYQERRFGAVNWIGSWTLYQKEVRRFVKVYTQTLVAPVVSSLLFLAVFQLALGGASKVIGGMPYAVFLAPGLTMMAVLQNAFANSSSSLTMAKMQGSIVDLVMPPLTPTEVVLALALRGATRGLMVGAAVMIAVSLVVHIQIHSLPLVLFHAVAASLLMSTGGVIAGLWADKFDHIAAVTNFVIMPLTFLSGTFYSIAQLPPLFRALAHADPIFYLIDGFRGGFIGHTEMAPLVGILVLAALNAASLGTAWWLLRIGYKLKA